MKEKIVELLKNSRGYISGEEISRQLNVSRTAVWKYINSIKEEGYEIESSSRKGYMLLNCPDILTPSEVVPLLRTKYIGREMLHFDSIDSTNLAARARAQEGCKEGLVVTAEEQTAGKGRLGRRWTSPKSSSITFSVVLRPAIKPSEASGITLVMGMAVCRAIKRFTTGEAGIKWPNDIILNRKKICGILTEMSGEIDAVNFIIVGAGINVNAGEFPGEIKDIATSMLIETGKITSRKEILASILKEFEKLYDSFKERGLSSMIDEYKSLSVTLGNQVKVLSSVDSFEGKAVDITDDGLLVVRLENGAERKVISGDVSVRGVNGYI